MLANQSGATVGQPIKTINPVDSRKSPTGIVERKKVMSSTYSESSAPVEAAAYGGLAHAIGGISARVLPNLSPARGDRRNIFSIAGIVFCGSPLGHGGSMPSR